MKRIPVSIIFLLLAGFLSPGCSGGISSRHATQTAAMQMTLAVSTATPSPLGSQANPLRIGYFSDPMDDQSLQNGSQVAALLGDRTDYSIELAPQPEYPSLMTALAAGQLHLVWLPPVTALAAQRQGLANAALIVNHTVSMPTAHSSWQM